MNKRWNYLAIKGIIRPFGFLLSFDQLVPSRLHGLENDENISKIKNIINSFTIITRSNRRHYVYLVDEVEVEDPKITMKFQLGLPLEIILEPDDGNCRIVCVNHHQPHKD